MDILAGLPKTKEGYQYILLVTYSFSHWAEAFPLKTQEAQEIADILYSEIFTRYGLVEALCLTEDKIVFQKLFPYFVNTLMLQDTMPAHIIPRVMLHVKD